MAAAQWTNDSSEGARLGPPGSAEKALYAPRWVQKSTYPAAQAAFNAVVVRFDAVLPRSLPRRKRLDGEAELLAGLRRPA